MAWRNLTKNKDSSFINIGGLSIGLATGIVIIMVIAYETSFDINAVNAALANPVESLKSE